jgi:hypothetical protein
MSDTPKTHWYEETPGVVSAKRIWGAAALALGIALKTAVGAVSMFIKLADPVTAMGAADGLLTAGAAILLGTAVENSVQSIADAKKPAGN